MGTVTGGPLVVRHVVARSVESAAPAGAGSTTGDVSWRYVYGGVAKPYLHPLHTPAGVPLTGFQPHSHPWHRGLWFTVKYVNGENFWEEGEEAGDGHGTQRTTTAPTVAHPAPDRAEIASTLEWVRPDGSTVVAVEQRSIGIGPRDDATSVDWVSTVTATSDLILDRTPFTTWGGYGGLALRLTRACRRSRMLFPGGVTSERPTGDRAPWCELGGDLDGGERAAGGAAILDHPANPRHPSPWYGAAGSMNFLNAAFLFHEPMRLAEGESLSFRYRVLLHDGVWDADRVEDAHRQWVGE